MLREPSITVYLDNSHKRTSRSKTILLARRIPMHFSGITSKHTGYLSQFLTSVKQLECWATVLYLAIHQVTMGVPPICYEFSLF